MEHMKPAQWGFDRGLIDSEWDWFWGAGAQLAVPYWDGTVSPQNIINGELGSSVDAVPSSTPFGRALELTTASQECLTRWSKPLSITDEITWVISFIVGAKLITNGGEILAQAFIVNGGGARANTASLDWGGLYTGTLLRARLVIGGLNKNIDTASVSLTAGDRVILALARKGNAATLFVQTNNGPINKTTGTPGTGDIDADFTTSFHVGSGDTSGQDTFDTGITVEMVYVANVRHSDSHIEQLISNPFGPFRMADDVTAVFSTQQRIFSEAAQRRGSAAWPIVPLMPGVFPRSAKDQEWRRTSAWCYAFVPTVYPIGGPAGPPKHEGFLINVGRFLK